MSDGSANLPQEIIRDILIHLPVKSIGRSRCVSKSWLSLLTSNEFIKTHLARQHTHLAQEQKLLLLSSSHSIFTLALHPDGYLTRKLESLDEKLDSLVGSCNGLVLTVTEGEIKCLINCLTEEYLKLPNSPVALDPRASFSMHGFGYDTLSDDYKIVSLSYYNTDNEYEPDCVDTFVDIFSLKTRSWRRFGSSPYDHAVPEIASGVFVKGALHWFGWKSSDNTSVIAAFDLSSEKFEEIPAPSSLDKDRFVFYKLVVVDGCLGIVADIYNQEFVEVWFMNNYSEVESWTKISIDMKSMSWIPLSLHKDKLLILEDGVNFIWYYPDDLRWEDWMVNDDHHDFDGEGENHGVIYSESLVSPRSLLCS